MQLGIHPSLRERVRKTKFPYELDETPYDMRSSKGKAEPQPNHPYASSTTFYGIEVVPVNDEHASFVNKLGEGGVIQELHEDPDKYVWLTRHGIDYCFGWTSYPRFSPSIYEIQLINEMFPDSVALPFSNYHTAEITLNAFLVKFPEMTGLVTLVPCNVTEGWCLEFTELHKNPRGQDYFDVLRDIREYLGTGMSPRQATYELLGRQVTFNELSLDDQRELTDALIDEYKSQFLSIHSLNSVSALPRDLNIGPNGTIVLVDVLSRMQQAVNIDGLKVATAGVPYSDTPITIEMVTGLKPFNTRSQNVQDIIDISLDADIIFVELGDNPLLQSTDLEVLNAFARSRGIPIIVDITSVGSGNIDFEELFKLDAILGATLSTTKYNSGTAMGGAFIRNPLCEWQYANEFAEKTDCMLEISSGEMFWADMAVHLRDLATYRDRLRAHNKNAIEVAELLSRLPGVQVNYPTQNGSACLIDPYLQKGAGYGGLLSIEFDESLYKREEVEKIINELPEHMTNALSFGLPFSVALPYASTVFPGKPKSETGCNPLVLRISMGIHDGESLEVYNALRTSVENVLDPKRFDQIFNPPAPSLC